MRTLLITAVFCLAASASDLHRAVESCDTAVVRNLLRSGAPPNQTIDGGNTPLHVAARNGNPCACICC